MSEARQSVHVEDPAAAEEVVGFQSAHRDAGGRRMMEAWGA